MLKSTVHKKKLVQNFQFDPSDVKVVQGYQIIKAKNILLNEVFTLKRLSLNDPQNQPQHQTMLKQISILKELSGINIIKCHKILKSKSHLYLVYDYFSGKNLAHLIQRNDQILQTNPKINKLVALKLQQDFVDFLMIQMIGKQLCQVLKQIQSHKIVHMRFWPQNIVLGKNNFIKLANFTHYQSLKELSQAKYHQQIQINSYVDPFLIQTHNFGFYTDIFSFGKILQKLYEIFRCSDSFKPNINFQQLVSKMVQKNSYRRPDLEQIYDFFFGKKRYNEQKVRKSLDQVIQRSTKMASTMRRTPSLSSTTSQKQMVSSTPKVRKSHNQIRSHPQRVEMRTLQVLQSINHSKKSNQISRTRSHTHKAKRQSNSPTPTQNSRTNYTALDVSSIKQAQNFKTIISNVIKKRNLSILLLKLGDVLASKITGQSAYALQLVFLLYKKSLIEIVSLAKYLSKGSKKYMPDVTETNRLRFTKTEEYFMLTKVVNEQLEQQRNILVSVSSLIKKECPSVMCFNSQGPSLVNSPLQLKPRQTYIPELPQFEKQLKYEAFSNEFFIKTIRKYLDMFVSDLLIINKSLQNGQQILFFLNIMWEIYQCGSYDNFEQEFFSIDWVQSQDNIMQAQKFPTYHGLLNMNLRLAKLKTMGVEELSQKLLISLQEE